MSDGKILTFRNNAAVGILSKEITAFIGRGSATTDKIAATLKEIKSTTEIKSLKHLEQSHIIKVANGLREKAESGKISLSTANSYISSLNNIVKYSGNKDLHTIKAGDFGLSRNIAEKDGINKENMRESAAAFKTWLDQKYIQTHDIRYAALKHAANIQSVNLRLRESLLVKLQSKDLSNNVLKISEKGDGSKNSRAREIRLNPEQKQALTAARDFFKSNGLKNLNLGTLKQGKSFANHALEAFRKETGTSFHYHGERHFQAHEAYKSAWQAKGYDIDCRARTNEAKEEWRGRILSETGLSKPEFIEMDKEIRQEISRDLGHKRIEITSRYLG